MTRPPLWLDVTETLTTGRRTGIQRVTIELARELLEQNQGQLIRYNSKTGCFVVLNPDEIASLFTPRRSDETPFSWHHWAARWGLTRPLGLLKDFWLAVSSRPPSLRFPWGGGVYLTAEILGNWGHYRAVKQIQDHVPTVLMLHDLFPLTAPRFSSLRPRAFDRHWRLALRATSVVAVSRATLDDAVRYAAKRSQRLPNIVVCHPGASLANVRDCAPNPLPPGEYFLFVGTLDHRKNQERLLEAYLRYRSEGGTTGLIFVGGSDPSSDNLVRTIERAAPYGVLWLRHAQDDTLKWLYQNAKAVVFPSLAEGFGLPLVEALSLGIPCLTSDRTSTAEIAELCGGCLVIDPTDIGALAKALSQFDHPEFRARLAATIRYDRIPTWSHFSAGVFAAARRLRLLFDVSSLGYGAWGNHHRTGLFRVALAYVQELGQHPAITLGLYASSGNRFWVERYLKTPEGRGPVWVGSPTAGLFCLLAKALEFATYREGPRFLMPILARLRAAAEQGRATADRLALSSWQAYFSPMEAPPTAIRRHPSMTVAILVHDLIPLVLRDYRQDPHDPTRWFSTLWRSLQPSDLIFTVSETTRQDWLRLRPAFPSERVMVALNAIDSQRFHPGVPSWRPSPYFLTVSTIEPRKRLDAVLAGYRAYRSQGGTTPLVVVGSGSSGLLEASDGVEPLGFVEDEVLPRLYRSCAAFLSLSDYEGFGLPILEAMACGAPVIVSDRSSHREVAGVAAAYVDASDVASIARVLTLLDDPEERKQREKLSLFRAAGFRWDMTVATVVDRILKEKES